VHDESRQADSMTTQNKDDGSVDGDDSAVALAALYEAERTEVQNILGHALTLVSVLVTYCTLVGVTWATRPDTIPHYFWSRRFLYPRCW
jgi:hypothetical protein